MNDHPDDIRFALSLALKCGSIHAYEEPAMRGLIGRSGLLAFENLLKARERGAAPDEEERIAQKLGVSKEWVAKRLK